MALEGIQSIFVSSVYFADENLKVDPDILNGFPWVSVKDKARSRSSEPFVLFLTLWHTTDVSQERKLTMVGVLVLN